ncbi:MAG: phytoene desaturase family protein [Balneolales bacterium]
MKISVIGAGLGGLAVSCLLSKRGHQVTVYEKNSIPGGKVSQVESGGFRFDTGPSLLTMPRILDKVFRLCGSRLEDHLTLIPLDPLCRYFFADGTEFNSYSDRKKALAAVRQIAPEDAEAYVPFLEYASRLYDRTAASFLDNPLQRLSDLSGINWTDAFRIDAFRTVSSRVDKSFRSVYMRQFFKRFSTYNGSSPYRAPATFNVIPHIELNGGGFYVDGGMHKITESLITLARALGVEFCFNAPVREIAVTGKTVTGLYIHDEYIGSDLVVANSDSSETYLNLIKPERLSLSRRNRLRKAEPSCSAFVMLVGINRKYEQLAHHNILFSKDYRREFDEIFSKRIMPADPTIYIANTSFLNPGHAVPGGSNFFIMVNAPYLTGDGNWSVQSQTYAAFLLRELENRGLSGLHENILYRQIINPEDFHIRYRSNKGSIYGTSSNGRYAAFNRPGNQSPWFENLYLTGGSTHPGGGIPLVMLSALHADHLIGRSFG